MSEFWEWAVAAYARPGAAEACLDLQDRYGQNVPLLLWALWRGGDVPAAVAIARSWEDDVVAPLRGVRRGLKSRAGAEALRAQVKAAELAAERTMMLALEAVAGPVVDEEALAAVTVAWGAPAPSQALARLRTVITGA
jgi:uncharacterized protein (TIGR02444 family)